MAETIEKDIRTQML